MNPFDRNAPINLQRINNPNDDLFPNARGTWGGIETDYRPSWLERAVGKGIGVLKGISLSIIAMAGLFSLIALFGPFILFMSELSGWLCDLVKELFY
jgi:hypothetical protein